MPECLVSAYRGEFEIECLECMYGVWSRSYSGETLRKINDDWNDHLKESHNDR